MTFTATVELEGVNGRMFTLSGPGMGLQGAHVSTNIEGLGDAPVELAAQTSVEDRGFEHGPSLQGARVQRVNRMTGRQP